VLHLAFPVDLRAPHPHVPSREGMTANQRTVYVKNLNFASTEEGLRAVFAPVGDVRAVQIPRRRKREGATETWQSLGYGFVEFGTHEGAKEAIKRCDGVLHSGFCSCGSGRGAEVG
jgi:RNA recognition motif-containing protein